MNDIISDYNIIIITFHCGTAVLAYVRVLFTYLRVFVFVLVIELSFPIYVHLGFIFIASRVTTSDCVWRLLLPIGFAIAFDFSIFIAMMLSIDN